MVTDDSVCSKIVQLDVGGTLFKVSRDTLERYKDSMLASLISKHWKEGNSEFPIFIDRSGRLFEHVLEYLRTDKVYLPSSVRRPAIEEEFEFYGIDVDMSRVIEKDSVQYTQELLAKIEAAERELNVMKGELVAIRLSHSAESEFLKTSLKTATVEVEIPLHTKDFSFVSFFVQRLRDKGLKAVGRTRTKDAHVIEIGKLNSK